jgi:RNA polymerase sigma-70 factor (ECF subfamily)
VSAGVAHPPGEEPSDDDLIQRFRQGNQDAFADLVRRHERRVYNLAYRMIGRVEDAREASQEAFLSCFRNLDRFRGDSAFSTWLHRITVNACYDILRRRQPIPFSDVELAEPPPAADPADAAVASADVQRALLEVPLEFRSVLIMFDLQGLPYEEIAQALAIPLGTVKSRLHRGRIAMGRALGTADSPAPVQATDP